MGFAHGHQLPPRERGLEIGEESLGERRNFFLAAPVGLEGVTDRLCRRGVELAGGKVAAIVRGGAAIDAAAELAGGLVGAGRPKLEALAKAIELEGLQDFVGGRVWQRELKFFARLKEAQGIVQAGPAVAQMEGSAQAIGRQGGRNVR